MKKPTIGVLALLSAICFSTAAEEIDPRIVAVDQATTSAVFIVDNTVTWRWCPSRDRKVKPADAWLFASIDECKVAEDGATLLVNASGGGVAAIDIASTGVVWYAQATSVDAGPHSLCMLPDGRVAVANSTGCDALEIIDFRAAPLEPARQKRVRAAEVPGAHGVVWNTRRNSLFVLGYTNLFEFAYQADTMSVKELRRWRYDAVAGDAWGHDLVPDAHGGYFFSNHNGVWRINPETGTISSVLARKCVKSFSRDSKKGDLLQIPTERWWSDRLVLIGPDGVERVVGPFPGARFYKARWFSSDALSAGTEKKHGGARVTLPEKGCLSARGLEKMTHTVSPAYRDGVLYGFYQAGEKHTVENVDDPTELMRLSAFRPTAASNVCTFVDVGVAGQDFGSFVQTTNRPPCAQTAIEKDGILYLFFRGRRPDDSQLWCYRTFDTRTGRLTDGATICTLDGKEFNGVVARDAYNRVSGDRQTGASLANECNVRLFSDGWYYMIACVGGDCVGLVVRTKNLRDWESVRATPDLHHGATMEHEIAELAPGKWISAWRQERLGGVWTATYDGATGKWSDPKRVPDSIAVKPCLFTHRGKTYLATNLKGSVKTPGYGTAVRATLGIFEVAADGRLTKIRTIVNPTGCHYVSAIEDGEDNLYLCHSTDERKLDVTQCRSNIGFFRVRLQSASPRVADLGGTVGARMRGCYETAVRGADTETLVGVFRTREAEWDWKTEFWGKWMHSAPVLAAYYGDTAFKARVAAATAALIATQTSEGYIGNYPPARQCRQRHGSWDVWGRKYTMLGLLHQYDYAHDDAALQAAAKVLDHLMTQCGPDKVAIDDIGNFRGMPSLSILEPTVWLYNRLAAREDLGGRTAAKKYLDFATYIVDRMDKGPGLISKKDVDVGSRFPHPKDWWTWVNGEKAYEMMSCYQGLIEYARTTGRKDCLAAAVAAGENIFETEINVCGSGASNECWYHGRSRQTQPSVDTMEGCVTVTWMRLCEALGRETGEAKWADRFECAFYNAYLGGLKSDGSLLAKYSALEGARHPGDHQCGLRTNCCSANGPRGFVEFLNYMAETRDGALVLNLFAPAVVSFDLPCGKGKLKIETEWPVRDEVRLTLVSDRLLAFAVRLREPGANRYREVKRTWKPGETVVEKLPLAIETVEQDGCIAFRRGPVVFARDTRLGDGDIRDVVWFPGAKPSVRMVAPPDFASQALEVDLARGSNHANPAESRLGKVRFVDYASAGSLWRPDNRYSVWQRMTFDPKKIVSLHD